MNFYYFNYIGCPAQINRTPQQFIERLNLPFALYDSDIANNVDRKNPSPQDQEKCLRVRLDGSEKTLKRKEVRDLHNSFIDEVTPHCPKCPVNVIKKPALACKGLITLPLSPEGEQYLFDQFNPPAPGHSYFLHHIQESKLPQRRHPSLVAAPAELKKRIGNVEITSTQLSYYLLNLYDIHYETRLRFLYEFGIIQANSRDIDEITALITMAATRGEHLADTKEIHEIREKMEKVQVGMSYNKGEDRSINELKTFFQFSLLSLVGGIPMCASLM